MNNYTQFFDKYTERTVNINNVAYQANLVNAVTSYLKNNGYQVTNNDIASGCQELIKKFGKNSTGISGNYGKNNTDTSRVNNVLAGVFPPKQNTVQNVEQQNQDQTNPKGEGNTNPQNIGNSNQGQNPQGNSGAKNSEDPKDTPPQTNPQGTENTDDSDQDQKDTPSQDNLMNDLAKITMLTKSELNTMVNQKIFSKAVSNVINKTKKDKKLNLEVYYMEIIGSDNVYDEAKENNQQKETSDKNEEQKND